MHKTLRRPALALLSVAAGAALLAGCSSTSDTVDSVTSAAKDATSAVASAADNAASAATSATDAAKAAVDGLNEEKAQTILRTAVDPATPADQIDTVVDVTDPATKAAIIGYAKGSAAGGYTPDVYTVKAVAAEGDNKAKVTVAVKSPHAPQPIDIELTYVKVGDDWKLSADAVSTLAGMGGERGGH